MSVEEARESTPREKFVKHALAERFLAEQWIAELSNVPVALVAVALVWSSMSHASLAIWLGTLVIVSIVRALARRRVERAGVVDCIPWSLRVPVVAVAAVWGAGMIVAATSASLLQVAILLLIICGLTAASTSTLLGDAVTYAWYTAAMLGLTLVAAVRLRASGPFVFAGILVVLYGSVMVALYQRLGRMLTKALVTEYELGASREAADRERAFLDQLFINAPTALAVIDRARRVLRLNPAFERMFGYAPAEALGAPLDELVVPDDQAAAAKSFEAAVQQQSPVVRDAVRRRKDGSKLTVRVSAAKITDTERVLVIYDDVSEMKEAEQALRESEARLFQTLASLPVAILVIEQDGTPYFSNDACIRLLGKDAAVGRGVDELAETYQAYVTGTDVLYPVERMPIVRALAGEMTAVDDMDIHRPDGTVTIEVFGSPIRDRTGSVIFGVAAFTDITERRRVEEALHAARVAAEDATAAKSAFLANMSHEIRTPLNGILGLAELLLDGQLSPDEQRSVGLIIDSGETLLRVINDILDFSKIEAHQLDIEHTDVDLASVVESTARLLMPKAVLEGVEIVTEIAEDIPPHVLGDPTRLRQVLTNLVGNAVKFTTHGEVVVTLAVLGPGLVDPGATRFRFVVRDTGEGIPADKLDTIFEAFRQADATTTRRYGGTGLGLSISRRLVELMGGTIHVTSTIGVGSEFQFDIELRVVDSPEIVATAAGSLRGVRVLVVDDNATNRRVMQRVLEKAGCDVTDAADGVEALNALRAARQRMRPFQLVMSDLVMPQFDGFDLIQAMRADGSLADIPVVIATSASRRGDAQRCRDLDVAAYLLKPVSRRELLDAVSAALGVAPHDGAPGTSDIIAGARDGFEPGLPHVRRILLAEDNLVNQEVAAAMLRRRGHVVNVVETGRAAVHAAVVGEYDVVLMDLQMPDMDGLEATREIRRRLGGQPLTIIALTANAMTGERERCLAAGMDAYISKPFKSIDLFAAVEGRHATPVRADAFALPAQRVEPAVDIEGLRSDLEAGGVGEILNDILELFTADGPKRMDALRTAVNDRDARAIERAAHAFKSAAGTIRARALADELHAMEREGHEGAVDAAANRLEYVATAYRATQAQLDKANEDRTHGE